MLPTFNEAENIENLIRKIHEINSEFEIVAVDDNSPDGTGEILEKLSVSNPHIHVIHRKDMRGRGIAGAIGFKECLKLNPDIIVEMDADFSHRPEFIPKLLERINDADVVIASRFVAGGEDKRKGIRRTISRIANFYTRMICGLNIYDPTSGFRAFRARVLKEIDLNSVKSTGPAIVQEILLRALEKKSRIIEIPYVFYDRSAGDSKLSPSLLFKTFFKVTTMGIRHRFKIRLRA